MRLLIPPWGREPKRHVVQFQGERFRASGRPSNAGSTAGAITAISGPQCPLKVELVLDLDRVGMVKSLTNRFAPAEPDSPSLFRLSRGKMAADIQRSLLLDKDPLKQAFWDELKNTVVDDVLQDIISALLPGQGRSLVDPLAWKPPSVSLHAKHTLVGYSRTIRKLKASTARNLLAL